MNTLMIVAVAAAYGVDKVRADGYHVDRAQFDQAIRLVAQLARVVDPGQLSSVASPRKLPEDGVMDATTVAARSGCTPTAVRLAAREGRIAGCKGDDGRWRFTVEAVEAWEATRAR